MKPIVTQLWYNIILISDIYYTCIDISYRAATNIHSYGIFAHYFGIGMHFYQPIFD